MIVSAIVPQCADSSDEILIVGMFEKKQHIVHLLWTGDEVVVPPPQRFGGSAEDCAH
ncbi:hypothetical protein [Sphingomonas parva]|uniref:hypothetical protein n=1 Tax=Sphingomonas parva TaxID=2555898 RepID=UPI001CDD2436|nr:hypothetical protein [Sphingomonas parva]